LKSFAVSEKFVAHRSMYFGLFDLRELINVLRRRLRYNWLEQQWLVAFLMLTLFKGPGLTWAQGLVVGAHERLRLHFAVWKAVPKDCIVRPHYVVPLQVGTLRGV
jgi:hypothetical protein